MSRTLASQVLQRIEKDRAFSHIVLANALYKSALDERDRALATELVYGTLTWQRTLDNVLEKYVRKGLESLDIEVLIALRVALYQILFLDRIPTHAAVDEAVELIKHTKGKGAAGFVNAVLRNILRQRVSLKQWDEQERDTQPARYLGQRYSLPDWIAELLFARFGFLRAEQIAEAFNQRPPYYLRQVSPQSSPEQLDGIEAVEGVPGALVARGLNDAIRHEVQEFRYVVQDLGSQLIGWWAGVNPGQSVLDGCAGLGGKTLHLAHLTGESGRIVAVEPVKSKVKKLKRALKATSLEGQVQVVRSDLQSFGDQTDQTFDCVVIDAPCSGLGVLRRHPETRWHRKPEDVTQLLELQKSLLDAAAPLVAPGGTLVYSVCTFTSEEGPQQIENFLARHTNFQRVGAPLDSPIDWRRFVGDEFYMILDPATHHSDAFFAARMQRIH